MGIPTYFRSILKDNPSIVECSYSKSDVNALFLDFNALIYNVFAKKTFNGENELIENVIQEVQNISNNIVKPKDLLYIAVDGTAPRAKMVQQRSRRYKSVFLEKRLKNEGKETSWNASNNICPGTKFMELFNKKMLLAIEKKAFSVKKVYFDGSFRPGEGEHKILPCLKNMAKNEQEKSVVVFSPDNDILSLCMLSEKKNIKILRYMDIYCLDILKKTDDNLKHFDDKNLHSAPMIYIDIDKFWIDFSKTMSGKDPENTLLDYNFLLSMVGNDFVPSLPFMKIRSGGLDFIIKFYNEIKNTNPSLRTGYLIDKKTLNIHIPFFKDLILLLAKKEDSEMKKMYQMFQQRKFYAPYEKEYKYPWQEFEAKCSHLYLFDQENPFFTEYEGDFKKINYNLSKTEWKSQYYEHFCNTTVENYNQTRTKIVHNYLESLKFCLFYYNKECPSWKWHYKYRVPPLFSDVYSVLVKQKFNPNKITFQLGHPFTPLEQLFLILPPDSFHLVPSKCFTIFQKYKMYYPLDFRVDATIGLKFIYSEAILPEFECFLNFISDIRQNEKKLSSIEKERFQILDKIYKFVR